MDNVSSFKKNMNIIEEQSSQLRDQQINDTMNYNDIKGYVDNASKKHRMDKELSDASLGGAIQLDSKQNLETPQLAQIKQNKVELA